MSIHKGDKVVMKDLEELEKTLQVRPEYIELIKKHQNVPLTVIREKGEFFVIEPDVFKNNGLIQKKAVVLYRKTSIEMRNSLFEI